MDLDGGPLTYASARPPAPLTLDEQAALAFAACGITGHALAELPYDDGTAPETGGGRIMMNLVGRTAASGDASHADTVFVIDDDGVVDAAPAAGLSAASRSRSWSSSRARES